MKKYLFIIACLGLQSLSGTEPAELVTVRASYQKQIQAATSPINLRYLEYLEGLKKKLGASGDVQGALAVQEEIDKVAALQGGDEKAARSR